MDNHQNQLETLNQQIKELAGIYHSVSDKFGISDSEFWVWYTLLIFEDEYSQLDICNMWTLPKQTVNSVVSNLVKRGFLFLENVPPSGKKKIIRLTDAGRLYGENIISTVYSAEQRAIARMEEDERTTCTILLNKYIRFLTEEINGSTDS